MNTFEKNIKRLLSGDSDKNISFSGLCSLLETLGFENRIRGSHHIYFKKGIAEIINLQQINNKAKPYQVKQVRKLLIKYNLLSIENG